MKGYTGEGFLGQGSRLGGRNIPMREMRRQARASAERRKTLSAGSGRKLGGAPVLRGVDMRQVIADAAARRLTITQGCASNTKQGDEIADQEARNGGGFRTKAEEEDANERAISEALWELVQEDEARKVGLPANAWKEEGLAFEADGDGDIPQKSKPLGPQKPESEDSNPRPLCPMPGPSDHEQPKTPTSWACAICTLVNPGSFLVCDACGIERPLSSHSTSAPTLDPTKSRRNPTSTSTNTTASSRQPVTNRKPPPPTPKRRLSHSDLLPPKRLGWNCRRCGAFMESKWWTCSACGLMKDSSG